MASLQESALIRIYRTQPNGNKTLLVQGRVEQLAPAGGAPDALAASVATPEKLLTINSPVTMVNDDILEIAVISDAADGLDVSDMIWAVPLVTTQGSKTIGRSDFANPATADVALVASVETVIAGYRVVEGQARLSGKIFVDLQDDT